MSRRLQVALLTAGDAFEAFYEETLGLDRETYVHEYRNDFVWAYASALAERDVDLIAYMPSTSHAGRYDASDGFSVRFLPIAPWWLKLRRLMIPGRTPVERYLGEWLNTRLLLESLKRALTDDAIAVLYVQEYWTARFDTLARRSPVPVVAGDHSGGGGINITLRKRGAFKRSRWITVQSRSELERVTDRYGAVAHRLTNGIDSSFFTPSDEPRERTILIVARLEDRQKRISDVIRALPMLDRSWRLVLAGTGPDEQAYRRLSSDLGVADRVELAGWIADREELRRLYRRCGVFVMASTWEAVTLAVLEAMACGTAVAVTPLEPMRDLIEDTVNGMFVPGREPQQIAATIERAYADRERLGAAARRSVVEHYDRRQQMARLADLLRAAAAAGSRS